MPWLIVVLGYLLGSIPNAYLAGRILKGKDIRQLGDGNVGARNAYLELGHTIGIGVFAADAAKGVLAILIARATNLSQPWVLLTGVAVTCGHNWPVFLGFRGGRGESTTVGVLLTIVPQPVVLVAGPALATLVLTRNMIIASCVLFIPLPLVGWGLKLPGILILYSVALPCLVGFTHFLRTRHVAEIKKEVTP